jgi:hypothetical protein
LELAVIVDQHSAIGLGGALTESSKRIANWNQIGRPSSNPGFRPSWLRPEEISQIAWAISTEQAGGIVGLQCGASLLIREFEMEEEKPFYESSNGDAWSLIRDPVSGAAAVLHRPNERSGGKVSYIDVDKFLRESPDGPQHQALRRLINADRSPTRLAKRQTAIEQ